MRFLTSAPFRRVAIVSTSLLTFLTLIAWLAPLHPWFELVSNFRMQLLLFGLIALATAALVRSTRLAGAAALVVAVQGFFLFGYWTPNADPVASAPTGQVLQYNIYFGNTNYDEIAATINESGADVVAIQELTDTQWSELETRLVAHPHQVVVPVSDEIGELGGGMALLSRTPLTEIAVDSPVNTRERPILAIETTVAERPVTVIGLHPHASRFSSTKVDTRDAQLDAVVATARDAAGPVIVMTDMNITPFSSDYKRFLSDTGWRDPHRVAGWNATWPAFAGPLGTPIDHVFVSNDVALHDYATGDGRGSDHRTLTATVSIPG